MTGVISMVIIFELMNIYYSEAVLWRNESGTDRKPVIKDIMKNTQESVKVTV